MPKFKIQKFNGIYTNVDENDNRLDIFRDSINFEHEDGYVKLYDRYLSSVELPNIETYLGSTIGTGWTWETGIYSTLTSDPFAKDTSTQWNVILLVAKKKISNTYHRLVWLKDDETNIWYELSKFSTNISGNAINLFNHNGSNNTNAFTNSMLSTTIDQKAFIKEGNGYLKLYLPHDTFWIGRFHRTMWYPADVDGGPYATKQTFNDQWYIDRLVDKFDKDNLSFGDWTNSGTAEDPISTDVPVFNPALGTVITDASGATITTRYSHYAGPDRRLGIDFTVETINSGVVDTSLMTWSHRDVQHYNVEPGLDFYWYPYTFYDNNNNPIPPGPFAFGNDAYSYGLTENPYEWVVITPFAGQTGHLTNIAFTASQVENRIAPKDYSGWGTVPGATICTAGGTQGPMLFEYNLPTGDQGARFFPSYNIPIADFDATEWNYTGSYTVSEAGFSENKVKYSIITTMILDEKEEIIADFKTGVASPTGTKYALKIDNINIPKDLNKRVTKIRFYLKFKDVDSDYELYKEIDLLNDDSNPYSSFFLYETRRTGILLSQNIGFLFDEETPSKYKIISGFRDIVSINNISIGLTQENSVNAYYSVVAGGVLQDNLLYDQNILYIPETTHLTAVCNINGNFGVLTDKKLVIGQVSESNGIATYTLHDTIEYGVRDRNDVQEIQGGVILHTINGIFFTNGYDKTDLSLPIQDYVKANYTNGNISYNPYLHHLYYWYDTSNIFLWRYRFDLQKWERYYLYTPFSGAISEIMYDFEGYPSYLFQAVWYTRDTTNTTVINGYLITNNSALGEISVDKLINYLDCDYKGAFTIGIYYDGILQITLTAPTRSSRGFSRIYMPLIHRKAFQKLKLYITCLTAGTIIYSIEPDFSLLNRRYRNG